MITLIAVGALALITGVALSAGPGKAAAVDADPSPFANVDNVILFIGDGMAFDHLEVGRQLSGGSLMMDGISWGGEGYTDTRSLDGITDSAAGGTALSTGMTTWNDWVAMGPDPATGEIEEWETILERAESVGKATGLVTDLELSDATPAVFAAHVEDRDYDEQITEQMRDHDIEALFSGGWGSADILGDPDVKSLREMRDYFSGKEDWPTEMLGIFGKGVLAYTLDREEEEVVRKQPTLPQLTEAVLGILSQDEDGFFAMIEAGSNDWGGHARDAGWVGAEIRELDEAVQLAYEWAQDSAHGDTLIVITADHECGGLVVSGDTRYDLIAKQSATTEWMWGLIKSGKMTVEKTLLKYAGIQVSAAEKALILQNKEMGISDVLAARFNVTWGWSGTDEGDHTAKYVPVMAWGPGAEEFGNIQGDDSEWVGTYLLDAVSH